jgi:hypothetical protein
MQNVITKHIKLATLNFLTNKFLNYAERKRIYRKVILRR